MSIASPFTRHSKVTWYVNTRHTRHTHAHTHRTRSDEQTRKKHSAPCHIQSLTSSCSPRVVRLSFPLFVDNQAYQRCYLHLQSSYGSIILEDHSHFGMGRSEASRSIGEVEDGRRDMRFDSCIADRRATETDHRHT